jgi:hypothetical protein
MKENRVLPHFDPKRLPYERWWANCTVLLDRRVPQLYVGKAKTKYRYRVEVFVEYMDGDRMYRNIVKIWETDPLTKAAVHAAAPNYILLTQMENPEPWNLSNTSNVRQIGHP